jgi:hypothetical protein
MADFTKRRNEQILDAMSTEEIEALARKVAPQSMAQADGWVASLDMMPKALAHRVLCELKLMDTLLDMARSEDAENIEAARKVLAGMIVLEVTHPDPAQHPWVTSRMDEARELLHGGPELAAVREEVRVKEARERMRGPTDAQR